MAKKTISIYVNEELSDFIDECLRPERALQYAGTDKRSRVLEQIIAQFCYEMLKGQVHKSQLGAAQQETKRLLRLAVYFMRWQRGEKGYDRIPGPMSWHGDKEPTPDEIKKFREDPANQIIVGPNGVMP